MLSGPAQVVQSGNGTLYLVQGQQGAALVPDQISDADAASLNLSGEVDGVLPERLVADAQVHTAAGSSSASAPGAAATASAPQAAAASSDAASCASRGHGPRRQAADRRRHRARDWTVTPIQLQGQQIR